MPFLCWWLLSFISYCMNLSIRFVKISDWDYWVNRFLEKLLIMLMHILQTWHVILWVIWALWWLYLICSLLICQEMKSQGVTADKLQLLSGISGAFRPGVLTALMGVSGSGKTILMDVLSGRKTGGYIEGEIYISGYPKNQETFARI